MAGRTIGIDGRFDASGATWGGTIQIVAAGDATIAARLAASGCGAGSPGGGIWVSAGAGAQGTLTLSNVLDASGGSCTVEEGCGYAGFTDARACNITIASTGHVLARSSDAGGSNTLVARERLIVAGEVNATKSTVGGAANGTNIIRYPSRVVPTLGTNIEPPPVAPLGLATCTASGPEAGGTCLDSCPVCGNAVVEFPETCDDGARTGCDGCSATCRIEACNSGSACLVDSCDPVLGCNHVLLPNGTACADGNACEGAEECSLGICVQGAPLDCNDGNPCTLDACNPTTGCLAAHPMLFPGTPCSDGNACTSGETCDGTGHCAGTPRVCNDSRGCVTPSGGVRTPSTDNNSRQSRARSRTAPPGAARGSRGESRSRTRSRAGTAASGSEGG